MSCTKLLAFVAATGIVLMTVPTPSSQAVEAVTVVIDASTTQPVGTGIVPSASTEHCVFYAQGAYRAGQSPPYTEGWMNPNGETRLRTANQPVSDMQFGALLGDFSSSLSNASFLGVSGEIDIQPAHVGQELRVGLNMSDASLANLEGSAVVTIVLFSPEEVDYARIVIDNSVTQPVPTGLFTESTDDRFLVLPYGAFRVLSEVPYTGEWFGPQGQPFFFRAGQPVPRAPYGSLVGSFNPTLTSAFNIGDGGTWNAQPADEGDELLLGLNMSDTDLAMGNGRFIVNVIRVDGTTPSDAGDPYSASEFRLGLGVTNPSGDGAALRYRLPVGDDVRLRVYDASGRVLNVLVDEMQSAGDYELRWDGLDHSGRRVPSGTYFFQLSTSAGSETRRVVLTQ